MAIVVPQRRQKEGTLDKIAKALQIGTSLLGSGMDVARFIEQKKMNKFEKQKAEEQMGMAREAGTRAQTGLESEVYSKYKDYTEGDQEKIYIGGKEMTPRPKDDSNMTQWEYTALGLKQAKAEGQPFIYNTSKRQIRQDTSGKPIMGQNEVELTPYNYGIYVKEMSPMDLQNLRLAFEGGKFTTGLKGDLNKDVATAIKDYKTELDSIRTIKGLVNSGSGWGENFGLTRAVKAIGKDVGALSEGDIKRAFPNAIMSDIQKIINYFSGEPASVLTPEAKAIINEILEDSEMEVKESRAEAVRNVLSSSKLSTDPETFKSQSAYFSKLYGIDELDEIKKLNERPELSKEEEEKLNKLFESFKGRR